MYVFNLLSGVERAPKTASVTHQRPCWWHCLGFYSGEIQRLWEWIHLAQLSPFQWDSEGPCGWGSVSQINKRKGGKARKEGRRKGCEPCETGQEDITYVFLEIPPCFVNLCAHRSCLFSAEINIQTRWVLKWPISWKQPCHRTNVPIPPAPPHHSLHTGCIIPGQDPSP